MEITRRLRHKRFGAGTTSAVADIALPEAAADGRQGSFAARFNAHYERIGVSALEAAEKYSVKAAAELENMSARERLRFRPYLFRVRCDFGNSDVDFSGKTGTYLDVALTVTLARGGKTLSEKRFVYRWDTLGGVLVKGRNVKKAKISAETNKKPGKGRRRK